MRPDVVMFCCRIAWITFCPSRCVLSMKQFDCDGTNEYPLVRSHSNTCSRVAELMRLRSGTKLASLRLALAATTAVIGMGLKP